MYGKDDSGRPTTRQVRRMVHEPLTTADVEIPATTRDDSDSDEGMGTGELSWMPDSGWVDVGVDLDMEVGDGQPRPLRVTDVQLTAAQVAAAVGDDAFSAMLRSQKWHRHVEFYHRRSGSGGSGGGGVGNVEGQRAGVVGWRVCRLRSGTRHQFRVRAENAVGGGLYSRPSRLIRVTGACGWLVCFEPPPRPVSLLSLVVLCQPLDSRTLTHTRTHTPCSPCVCLVLNLRAVAVLCLPNSRHTRPSPAAQRAPDVVRQSSHSMAAATQQWAHHRGVPAAAPPHSWWWTP